MDKHNTKTTINKWFSFIKTENLSLTARQSIHQFDAYTKKLTFERVLKLFLFAINNETESLRHLDQQLVDPKLKKAVGVNRISYSQLSRALKVIDNEVLLEIFYQLLSLVRQKTAGHSNKRVYLIDSTMFSFSQPSYPWTQFRQTKSGVKLHLSVCFMENGTLHPEQFEISNAVEHDHDFLDVLVNKPLATFKQKEVKTIKDIKEYDESFKHKQQNYTKPSPRKESLPEWAYSGYTIKDELVDGDVDKRFKNKLEKIRAKNSTP
ncbi:hypothetical protein [Ruoffia tabacinasalis]|uniref:hypothetical protein n=1 Tax=Ruoffia tabacinasalis TaxID=87458 RepID=UPI0030CE068A